MDSDGISGENAYARPRGERRDERRVERRSRCRAKTMRRRVGRGQGFGRQKDAPVRVYGCRCSVQERWPFEWPVVAGVCAWQLDGLGPFLRRFWGVGLV